MFMTLKLRSRGSLKHFFFTVNDNTSHDDSDSPLQTNINVQIALMVLLWPNVYILFEIN